MQSGMRDETKPVAARLDMAKAAAPYVHPRILPLEQKSQGDSKLEHKIIVEFVDPESVRGVPLQRETIAGCDRPV